MKIALMMENSQPAKMPSFITNLAPSPMKGISVFNVGMCDENDHHLTYIHLGIMASILLNANAVDFVVTGCGTGQGALMSLNIHRCHLWLLHRSGRCFSVCADQQRQCVVPAICERLWLGR